MLKLDLDALVVESFATVDMPRQLRGTVEGRQNTLWKDPTCDGVFSCIPTCLNPTCEPSCRDTECVTACQGGGELTKGCVQTE